MSSLVDVDLKYKILEGDCRKRLQELPRWSVDCIYTSPSPLTSRTDCVDLLVTVDACYRVLKDTGSMWIELHDGYSPQGRLLTLSHEFINMLSPSKWILRDRLIWQRIPNEGYSKYDYTNVYGEMENTRFKHDYSFIFRLVKDVQKAYFDITLSDAWTTSILSAAQRQVQPGEIDSGYPHEIIADCLLTSCPSPGGLVLDPYCGWGSTGVVALENGMWFIGIEREGTMIPNIEARLARSVLTKNG